MVEQVVTSSHIYKSFNILKVIDLRMDKEVRDAEAPVSTGGAVDMKNICTRLACSPLCWGGEGGRQGGVARVTYYCTVNPNCWPG